MQVAFAANPQASVAEGDDEFAAIFDSPVGLHAEQSQLPMVEDLDEDSFVPLGQKLSLSPLHNESVAASASELLYSELTEKTRLLELAKQEAQEFKSKCLALKSSLSAVKKRQRQDAQPVTPEPAVDPDAAPKKKPSPSNDEPKAGLAPAELPANESDDEVPPPEPPALQPVAKECVRPFQLLGSILCGYKDDKVVPGSEELPFDLCAELCKEEASEVSAWDPATCKRMHEAVLSALRLVYPHKKDAWFSRPFLVSPSGAAKYWSRVLMRRCEIWTAAAKKVAALHRESLEQRIRRKINERRMARMKSLSKGALAITPDPYKTPVRKQHPGLSSDSDDDHQPVIDLSQSPAASSSGSSASASVSPPKAAPHPKLVLHAHCNLCRHLLIVQCMHARSYTLAEMKTFKKMAKAIRNVDEREGHADATAAFIDSEFSDNSGYVAKALHADLWRRNRVSTICEKAAIIMEDRCPHAY